MYTVLQYDSSYSESYSNTVYVTAYAMRFKVTRCKVRQRPTSRSQQGIQNHFSIRSKRNMNIRQLRHCFTHPICPFLRVLPNRTMESVCNRPGTGKLASSVQRAMWRLPGPSLCHRPMVQNPSPEVMSNCCCFALPMGLLSQSKASKSM